jgi:hypothetical protein
MTTVDNSALQKPGCFGDWAFFVCAGYNCELPGITFALRKRFHREKGIFESTHQLSPLCVYVSNTAELDWTLTFPMS